MLPFLFWAAVGGAQRWEAIAGKPLHAFVVPAAAIVVLALRGPVAAGDFDRSPVSRTDGTAALSRLGPDDRLLAQPDVGARASQREMVLLYPYPFAADCQAVPRVAGERNIALWPASEIDTVVLPGARTAAEQTDANKILKSPCFADLGPPEHIGGLSVYRRLHA
jgi:hypothetical protein